MRVFAHIVQFAGLGICRFQHIFGRNEYVLLQQYIFSLSHYFRLSYFCIQAITALSDTFETILKDYDITEQSTGCETETKQSPDRGVK